MAQKLLKLLATVPTNSRAYPAIKVTFNSNGPDAYTLDVRRQYEDDNGELQHTPKGLTFDPEHAPQIIAALQAGYDEYRKTTGKAPAKASAARKVTDVHKPPARSTTRPPGKRAAAKAK